MAMMQFEQKTVDNLKIGDFSLFTKTVSETDIVLYAGISADFAPVHLNEQYAAQTRFGSRIAHPHAVGHYGRRRDLPPALPKLYLRKAGV